MIMIMSVGRAEGNSAGASLLWERCGRPALTCWQRREKGAGIHFNLQSVDNCPFFLYVLDWALLIEIQATAGIG
jgi:hypothetical protein